MIKMCYSGQHRAPDSIHPKKSHQPIRAVKRLENEIDDSSNRSNRLEAKRKKIAMSQQKENIRDLEGMK